MSRPNILLVMTDNQSAAMLGCYGNSEIVTPHIDALSERGVRFDDAYCVNAMCSPCRASVLTGLMPSQHGIHNWLDDGVASRWPQNWNAIGEFPTFPDRLKQAGYNTALIGKYHLGDPHHRPEHFDHWVTFPHGHTVSFFNNEMNNNGRPEFCAGHSVAYFTDRTIDFLKQRDANDEPFFVFLPYNGPYGHWPAIKGKSNTGFDALYDEVPMNSVAREGLNPDVVRRFALRVLESGGMPHERFMGPLLLPNHIEALRNYYAQISLIDDGVGRIVEHLRTTGQLDNTLIVYTADHGFSLGNHGVWGHGLASWPSTLHRSSTVIPLIASWPAQLKQRVETGLTTQLDLGPTLLQLAGLDPDSLHAGSAAQSRAQQWEQGGAARDCIYLEQEETRAIRTPDWLLMQRFEGAQTYPLDDALFKLDQDPDERDECRDRYPEQWRELRARNQQWFDAIAEARYDLWRGGSVKSNSAFEGIWRDAWGEQWHPLHS